MAYTFMIEHRDGRIEKVTRIGHWIYALADAKRTAKALRARLLSDEQGRLVEVVTEEGR